MKRFKIDLGQSDYLIISTSDDSFNMGLLLEDIKNQGEWFTTGQTVIQVSHIKRIEQIS
jgi:hypothetical protein